MNSNSSQKEESAVSVDHSVIYKAIANGELSVRMQRKFLVTQFAPAIARQRMVMRKRRYIASTHLIWRMLHFLNGEREQMIRRIELGDGERYAAENLALARCTDMSLLDHHLDMAYRLKNAVYDNMNHQSLPLTAPYLQFVMTFNPEAFVPENQKDPDSEIEPSDQTAMDASGADSLSAAESREDLSAV